MSFTNIVDYAGWSGAYGLGLIGSGKIISSIGCIAAESIRWSINVVTTGDIKLRKVTVMENGKPMKAQDGTNVKEYAFTKYARSLIWGVAYTFAGLMLRQVVSRVLSPQPPELLGNALRCLGWAHVRSPIVQKVVNVFHAYTPISLEIV